MTEMPAPARAALRIALAFFLTFVESLNSGSAASASPPASESSRPRLSVESHGLVLTVPDIAVVRVGVAGDANDEDSAMTSIATISQALIARCREFGVEAKDIGVSRIKVSPRYETPIAEEPPALGKQVGYTGSNTLTITVRDIPRIGVLLRELLKGGANVIEDIQFALTDDKLAAAKAEARAKALKAAQNYAQAAASAAGVKLGTLLSVGDPPSPDGDADLYVPPELEPEQEPVELGQPLRVEPGVIDIGDEILAVWEIGN